MYKSELGKEASAALRHNKELLKYVKLGGAVLISTSDKKSSLKIICATLNEMKIEIDSIVTLLEKKKVRERHFNFFTFLGISGRACRV